MRGEEDALPRCELLLPMLRMSSEAGWTASSEHVREIAGGEKRLTEMGGVRGAEQKVQRSLEGALAAREKDAAARVAEKSGGLPPHS